MFLFPGTITTRTSLDRSQRVEHVARVSAVDGGGRAGYAVVRVHVTAEPATLPKFLMTEYRANVLASVQPHTSVVKVTCRYVDDS